MPSWIPPVLIVVAVGALVVALDRFLLARRGPRSDDQYWAAGMFYVNRDDPRLVVPKRFGFGRTLNFGHGLAWVLVLAPVVLAVLLSVAKR